MVNSDISSAPSRFFSPALSTQAIGLAAVNAALFDNNHGQLVTDVDDVSQCIHIIISTPKGSDPHRPLFGSNIHLYIDYPINRARPYLVREITDALRSWEPRIKVIRVRVEVTDIAELSCYVEWQFAADVVGDAFVTNLSLGLAA